MSAFTGYAMQISIDEKTNNKLLIMVRSRCAKIVLQYHKGLHTGIPIGNHFGNHHLDKAFKYAKQHIANAKNGNHKIG